MKWEHIVVYVMGTSVQLEDEQVDVQEFIDDRGADGWEVVTAVPLRIEDHSTDNFPDAAQYALYLKRESRVSAEDATVTLSEANLAGEGGTIN